MAKTQVVNIRRHEAFDIYIGRASSCPAGFSGLGSDGRFGNPILPGVQCGVCRKVHQGPLDTLECFKSYLMGRLVVDEAFRYDVQSMKGKRLGCFCSPAPCHGDSYVSWLEEGGWLLNGLVQSREIRLKSLAARLSGEPPPADAVALQSGRDLLRARFSACHVVAVTGHRPDKLGGRKAEVLHELRGHLVRLKLQYGKVLLITGMALGVDQWAAEAASCLDIPFVAAVPFAGQEKCWPDVDQVAWLDLLHKAAAVVVTAQGVEPSNYREAAEAYQRRNTWMVEHADEVLAVWDGSKGGTAHAVSEARRLHVPIIEVLSLTA